MLEDGSQEPGLGLTGRKAWLSGTGCRELCHRTPDVGLWEKTHRREVSLGTLRYKAWRGGPWNAG